MLRLQHLKLLEVPAVTGPPDKSCTDHHKADKLLIKQYTVSDYGCGPRQSLERCQRVRRERKQKIEAKYQEITVTVVHRV
jgi:hypothetical protein